MPAQADLSQADRVCASRMKIRNNLTQTQSDVERRSPRVPRVRKFVKRHFAGAGRF
jgi:hypothetical protein